LRVGHLFGLFNDANLGAHFEQRLVDAAQVAGPIIEQSNHRHSINHISSVNANSGGDQREASDENKRKEAEGYGKTLD